MAVDISKIALGKNLEEAIFDLNGNPLTGFIYSYRDNARTTPKPLYTYNGNPGNPSFIELANPVSVVNGYAVDETGTNCILYYYPYNEDTSTTPEPYFIQVEDANTVLQFTRENFPYTADTGATGTAIDNNLIPNGQFYANTTLPAETQGATTYEAGEIRAANTNIAYGNWFYTRSAATLTAGKDIVTFTQNTGYSTIPQANPRFFCKLKSTDSTSALTFKDLRIRFRDVNMFASDSAEPEFTFSYYAKASVGPVQAELYLIKNYGTGGSPSSATGTLVSGGQWTITTAGDYYSVQFKFGDNSGQTMPALDDYVEIAIRLPTNSVFEVDVTDVILAEGKISDPVYPETPVYEVMSRAIAGMLPRPASDGSDIGLPIVLGSNGLEYSSTSVGQILTTAYPHSLSKGEKLCDGSMFETSAIDDTDGIPYARLQAKLWDDTNKAPRWGTGKDYVSAEAIGAKLLLRNNNYGTATAAVDGTGALATGFDFAVGSGNPVHTGSATSYGIRVALAGDPTTAGDGYMYMRTNANVSVDPVITGTALSFVSLPEGSTMPTPTAQYGNYKFQFDPLATVTTMAATHFTYASTGATADHTVWFSVDGTGTAPAITGTEVKINLSLTDTYEMICKKVVSGLGGGEVSWIGVTAPATIPAGSYFEFQTTDTTQKDFYVWYKKDNAGTDPAVPGKKGIQVDIVTADTDAIVASKTHAAINMMYFAIPDLRGAYLRMTAAGTPEIADPTEIWNHTLSIPPSDMIGGYMLDDVRSHSHNSAHSSANPTSAENGGHPCSSPLNSSDPPTTHTGGDETRPYTAIINYVIKY